MGHCMVQTVRSGQQCAKGIVSQELGIGITPSLPHLPAVILEFFERESLMGRLLLHFWSPQRLLQPLLISNLRGKRNSRNEPKKKKGKAKFHGNKEL